MSFILAWWDAGSRQYTSYTTRVADEPDHGRHRHAGGSRLGRHVERPRHRPLDLHVQDRAAGRLRPDDDDDARHLRDARHVPTSSARTTTPTSSTTSSRRRRPSPQVWDVTRNERLQHLPQPALRARRLAPGRQALRPVPLAADDRSGHRQHGRLQGDDPQDPQGREPAERRRPARPTRSSASSSRVARLLRRRLPAGHPQLHDLPRRRPGDAGAATGTRTRAARPASPATTTSTSRPARTTRPGRRPTTAPAPPATMPQGGQRVGRLGHRRAHGSRTSRRS